MATCVEFVHTRRDRSLASGFGFSHGRPNGQVGWGVIVVAHKWQANQKATGDDETLSTRPFASSYHIGNAIRQTIT